MDTWGHEKVMGCPPLVLLPRPVSRKADGDRFNKRFVQILVYMNAIASLKGQEGVLHPMCQRPRRKILVWELEEMQAVTLTAYPSLNLMMAEIEFVIEKTKI